MTREELIEALEKGYSTKELVAFCDGNLSEGRINILRHQGVEGQVYHYNDINATAIVDALDKHEIDYSELTIEHPIFTNKGAGRSIKLEVGDMTKFGKVDMVLPTKDTTLYVIGGKAYRKKDLA